MASLPASYRPQIIGHRGVPGLAPENTLAAIEKAKALKLDYVEIDVRATKDGTLVLLHDDRVDRTTNGTGPITSFTAERLRSLDAGVRFSPVFAGERVPLLDEALELMHGKIGAYVDVKCAPLSRVYAALRRHDMLEQSVVYVSGGPLRTFARHAFARVALRGLDVMPEVGTACGRWLSLNLPLGTRVVAASNGALTRELIERFHDVGVKVFADVLGDRVDAAFMRDVLDLAPDGIQTDRPEVWAALLRGEELSAEGGSRP